MMRNLVQQGLTGGAHKCEKVNRQQDIGVSIAWRRGRHNPNETAPPLVVLIAKGTTTGTRMNPDAAKELTSNEKENTAPAIVREGLDKEIVRAVLRCKLAKRRHLVLPKAIQADYLDALFPDLLRLFQPQTVHYNGGVAAIKEWKISCYLEVMDGGVPTTNPSLALLELFRPLLQTCNELFQHWYRQQHACNHHPDRSGQRSGTTTTIGSVRRLMTFVTRYTPAPDEQALLKVSRTDRNCARQTAANSEVRQQTSFS
jgi:hypothetical protein